MFETKVLEGGSSDLYNLSFYLPACLQVSAQLAGLVSIGTSDLLTWEMEHAPILGRLRTIASEVWGTRDHDNLLDLLEWYR